jgi:O-antigen/teichoic acid export membrane protein
LKELSRNLAIYGVGDVATSLIGFLLLPVYPRYLGPSDYGIVALLLTIEAPAKILFRWGVDTAFMRLYYDCPDQPARQRLASTIFLFLFAANGVLVLATVASAGWIGTVLFGSADQAVLVALTIGNTFVLGFSFIPFHVLRIQQRPGQFIALTFGRSAGTLVSRLVLVVGFGMGVFGVVVADAIVTLLFTIVLAYWFAPLLRPMFSVQIIGEALRFGLPRIPHSLGQQVISLSDRYFLSALGRLSDVGLYSIGATFGLSLKLFLGAFEAAWTPFFLGVMKEPGAKGVYATVSTYAIAVLMLLGGGLCAIAPDLIRLATPPDFHSAAAVTPWIALGVMFQGFYIIGSIGLVITKRTIAYPIATGTAAGVSLLANAILIPTHGMMGAAWANTLSYGTLAAVTVGLSWRAYPIPYEWSRLLRVLIAGGTGFLVAGRSVPGDLPALIGVSARAGLMVSSYLAVLMLTRFFHPGELRWLAEKRRQAMARGRPRPSGYETAQAEMAGEIVAAAPGPDDISVDSNGNRATPGSPTLGR